MSNDAPKTRLREIRRASGLSVWHVATKVGISENWWYDLELGGDPKLSVAIRISELFNKPLVFIWPYWGEIDEPETTTATSKPQPEVCQS